MSRIFPKKKDTGKRPKPSFDEWIKKTNELLNEYMDEPVGEMFGSDNKKIKKASQNIKEKPEKNLKITKEEGDPAAERRIEESREKRKKEKLYEENKSKSKRKTLRKALIYSEILGKPVSKRK